MTIVGAERVVDRSSLYTLLQVDHDEPISLPGKPDCSGRFAENVLALLRALAPDYFSEEHRFDTYHWKGASSESSFKCFLPEVGVNSELRVKAFKEEVTVEVDQDQLIVRGVQDRPNTGNVEYIHRGLAARDFELVFRLENYLEVLGAKVDNGMLQIDIKRIIPEALKPRQIEIK